MNPSANEPAGAPEPRAWHKGLVALLAVAFFLTPYLFSSRPSKDDALGAELVGDGLALVTGHEALLAAQRDPSIATLTDTLGSTWWGSITGGQALYRPIPTFLLGVAGAAGGPYSPKAPGDKTFPYHVIVLALNVLCALLVFELAWLVFKSSKAALVAGALFATLPIHGEVIFDVAGVAELSATAFSLAAWVAWIRAGDRPFARPAQLAIALVTGFLATLCKESAFALPLVFFLFDLGRAKSGGIGEGFRHALSKLPALAALVVVLGVSLWLRYTVGGAILPTYVAQHALDNPLHGVEDIPTRVMNALRVLAGGTAAVFGVNPLSSNWNYSPDYSANQIAVLPAFSLWNLVGLAAVVGAIGLAIALFRKCRTRAALVFAFFGAALLTSNVLVRVGTIYADRLMFFPSVAAVLFLAAFLAKRGTVGVALGLALALGGGAWNWWNGKEHWRSQEDLWGYASKHAAPDSARARYNLAVDEANDQVYSMARTDLAEAVAIFPRYAQAHAMLGLIHTLPTDTYDLELAIDHFEEACEIQLEDFAYEYPPEPRVGRESFGPRQMLFWLTRFRLYEDGVRDPEGHLAWIDSLIAKGYDSAYAHHRRGETLLALDRVEEAEAEYVKSLAIEPTRDCMQAYGKLLLDLGRAKDALALFAEIPDFGAPGEKVPILLARAQAEFSEGPEKVLETSDLLWEMRDDLARSGEYVFTPQEEFQTLFLRAQAKYAIYGPNPTRAQTEELTKILKNALGAWNVLTDETFPACALLTQLLATLGEYEEAQPILVKLLSQREAPSLRFQLGMVYAHMGRLEDALDQLTRVDGNLATAAEMWPDDPSFLGTLLETRAMVLDIYGRLGRSSDAYKAIDEWHQLAGGYDPNVLIVQAQWELSRGDLDAAFEAASTLRLEFPEEARGPKLEDTLRALRAIEEKAAASNDPQAFEELAVARRSCRNHSGAVEMAERAVSLSKDGGARDLARRLSLLAACHESAGNFDAALGAIHRALGLALEENDRAALEMQVKRLEELVRG